MASDGAMATLAVIRKRVRDKGAGCEALVG